MTQRQSGMSLVEILIGMVIGLIGMVVITEAYLASDGFNRAAVGTGSGQSNGLIALFTLQRDIAMAGFGVNQSAASGCGILDWYYKPNYSPNIQAGSPLPNIESEPVLIDSAVVPNTITVMYSSASQRPVPALISGFVPASSEVTVDNTSGFSTGDLILLVNQTTPPSCTIAQITNVQSNVDKLQMNPGANGLYNPPAWGLFPGSYGSNDLVFDLGTPSVRTYSVATPAGASGKYRLQVTDALVAAAGGVGTLDVVDGVVDLRAQYGKDDGAGGGVAGDGVVDEYNNVQPANAAEWAQVLSLRIGVLVRISHYQRPNVAGGACAATTTAPSWEGGTFTLPEGLPSCYQYRVFQTVVPLRNMIWRQ